MQRHKQPQELRNSITKFCGIHSKYNDYFKRIKFRDLNGDVKAIYSCLGTLLFNPQHTKEVATYFQEELLNILLCSICWENGPNEDHLKICVALSKIIWIQPDVYSFVLQYFEKYAAPFEDLPCRSVLRKRMKTMGNDQIEITDVQIVEACYNYLKYNVNFFRSKWKWSNFIDTYYNQGDHAVKWFYCHCVRILCGMNEVQFLSLLQKANLPKEFVIEQNINIALGSDAQAVVPKVSTLNLDFTKDVVSIGGIYLPLLDSSHVDMQIHIVEVPSTQTNLHKIALGVAANKPICLQGPVGCGKTILIEYLAQKTGRVLGKDFTKVQLGDETDGKMLLGTYRCTDVPGEFVWQAGILTQAVMDGSWLLLEDIDLANMDIASVLNGLLENNALTVPGYQDSLPIKPGFQLFMTQRLVPTVMGFFTKKISSAVLLLQKNTLRINIEPLAPQELEEIIKVSFPALKTIANRLVSVFLLFTEKPSTYGRLISTRDLFKWSSRVQIDFDVTCPTRALGILQDAIDIFCYSYSNTDDRQNLARNIATELGIINENADFFCSKYKPNIKLTTESLMTNRVALPVHNSIDVHETSYFTFTRPSACLLERIMCCVKLKEPVLLVGETGTGKTSVIQYLSHSLGFKLIVINMNQQSDSVDLLGGYKPVELKIVISPVWYKFKQIFCAYYDMKENQVFFNDLGILFKTQKWSNLVKGMLLSYESALKRLRAPPPEGTFRSDEAKERIEYMLKLWNDVGIKLKNLLLLLKSTSLAFSFIEGSLVKAVQNGYWVLLDEINLANAETLECLSGLLEGVNGSLSLLERGDKEPIKRHPEFTLFACMNPSTDVGKKDLPAGLRNRFTEFFIDELVDKNDLLLLVNSYLKAMILKPEKLHNIVRFYLHIRREANCTLCDGLGHKPHFSLRTLCRALMIAARNPCGVFLRSLYEAFCLSFLTQLDTTSYGVVESLIITHILGGIEPAKSILNQPIQNPESRTVKYIEFEGYWVSLGKLEPVTMDSYILTKSVRKNLKDLVRVVSLGRFPVLLQGDTSVGKTSLITYLAKSSGNKCVRINNHEHTDLQEYIGFYVPDASGKLVFREGLLVKAMREGHWVILDELNLAPTDVLEALNRVLDDNRELFIPETQETVKADPKFMLFATQNPPGAYGGRKMLSRAFRNRFVELHFNEIPSAELMSILQQRCQIPPSYSRKMVEVMTELQTRRKGSAAFAGKQGFMTLRDLFRWGERYQLAVDPKGLYDWDQHVVDEGYLLIAGRVRKAEEKKEIALVLQKHFKRDINPENLFTFSNSTSNVTKDILKRLHENQYRFKNIVWTFNLRQLAVLAAKALEFHEPVLLVGETGGGKTTICKLLADIQHQDLYTVNCHMHTESSDFIGGLRPVRDHSKDNSNRLFEWNDGPLIQAMKQGAIFLADEISLADDSVLERLNSLLEPERSLLLSEKGDAECDELILANSKFRFVGTMNPGGDYGKKELSPALKNRFTEVWCESCIDRDDLIEIIEQNLEEDFCFPIQEDGKSGIGGTIMDFVDWFKNTVIGQKFTISIRDILTWVDFINASATRISVADAYLHGACLLFLDSFGSGVTGTESALKLTESADDCLNFLKSQLQAKNLHITSYDALELDLTDKQFGIKPFYIPLGSNVSDVHQFRFDAPTCAYNTLRLLRGLQLTKAILLEGSPGVGKTSLVMALAERTGNKIVRINLSDQTDVSDLFGADLPVEDGECGQFVWRDGPFLQALRQGHWILLDELNLASQSVLEGLNACLDHRGEIFIPELGKTFHVKPGTKLFACQNPLKQGGARRGLPQSFLNRFTQVYLNVLSEKDLQHILSKKFPALPETAIIKMIQFNTQVTIELDSHAFGHYGAPWEFNLRDLVRWCEVLLKHAVNSLHEPERFVQLIYSSRMRTLNDKIQMDTIFKNVFCCEITGIAPVVYVTEMHVYIGDIKLNKEVRGVNLNVLKQKRKCLVLRNQVPILRSLAYCVEMNWMTILIGSTGIGKSSVVQTLADLLGKTLHTLPVTSAMDTTDILGGFEQVDYTRHLEEITRSSEELLLETVQECMINSKKYEATELYRMWEAFSALLQEEKHHHTMSEKTHFFLLKLQRLNEMLIFISKNATISSMKDNVLRLLVETQKLADLAVKEGTLNAGGKFEWVDSILLKCLRNGNWLLMDNVNLCSPAVLDRLNAVLEPNGVLTIGERGVNDEGKMVEIKPHKDFRLFLTMDPKNGEISRAMRNRGVDICIINEVVNEYDIKSLIYEAGLHDNKHIETLLKLHEFMIDITLGEKPNINHLLQAAFLISQMLLQGTDVFKSFFSAIVDVYYKSKNANEFDMNDPLPSIEDGIKSALNSSCDQFFKPEVTLQTLNLSENSQIEKIKQQTVLLRHFNQNEALFPHLLINYCTLTSYNDLETSFGYVKKSLVLEKVRSVSEKTYDLLFRQTFRGIPGVPDLHWLPDYHCTRKELNYWNELYLFLYTIVQTHLNNTEIDTGMSLKTFLTGIRNQKIVAKIEDPLEQNLLNLIDSFDNFFLGCFYSKPLDIDDKATIEIILLLQWRFVLQRLLNTDIRYISKDAYQDLFVNLHVHYKWFLKFSVEKLVRVLDCVTIDSNLASIIEEINSSNLQDFSVFNRLCKRFQKSVDRPPPLISNLQIDTFKEYKKITDKYSQPTLNTELRIALIDIKTKLDYDFTTIPKSLLHVKSLSESSETNTVDDSMLPVCNYLADLAVVQLKCSNFELKNRFLLERTLTIPHNIVATLENYNTSKDERLSHELKADIYNYLLNSASINCNQNVSIIQTGRPILSSIISDLLVNDICEHNNIITPLSLGNYQNSLRQNNSLNKLLWSNLQQISNKDYEYLECETKYIYSSYSEFIAQLSKTLEISINNDNAIENSIIKIRLLYNGYCDTKNKKDMEVLIYILSQLDSEIAKLNVATEISEKVNAISNIYILLNLFKVLLNSKLSNIDPLAKIKFKKQYCTENIGLLLNIKQCLIMQNEINSGVNTTVHSHVTVIDNKTDILKEQFIKLGKHVAIRPHDLSYSYVYKEIQQHLTAVLDPEYIISLYKKMNEYCTTIEKAICDNSSLPVELYEKFSGIIARYLINYTALIQTIKQYRYYYPDILEPLLCNIVEYVYGIHMKNNLYNKLIACYKNRNINTMVLEIMQFPSTKSSVEVYSSRTMQCFVTNALSEEEKLLFLDKIEGFRLLKCGILQLFNECLLHGTLYKMLHKLLFKEFDSLIKVFVNSWKQQQVELEAKQKEEESLYKLKCKSEEEEIELEFKELFPSFHDKDFHDINLQRTLGDDPDVPTEINSYVGVIKLEDVIFVSQLHQHLLKLYTKTEWFNPKQPKNVDCDYVTPLILKCKLVKIIFDRYRDCLDYTVDSKSLGFMNILVAITQNFGEVHFNSDNKEFFMKKNHDFYKDPEIDEVKSSYCILEELRRKISAFLIDWPGHPNLQMIQTIIDRIFSFEITSPLSRFLTGFEILLTKCHEWEQNAHSDVSLFDHSQNLIQKIITWRKLEMNMWKNSLNCAFIRMNEPIAKWWFFIYDLMIHFTQEDISQSDHLITVLRDFMLQSNLAEFESRLSLLLTFHCHATYLDYDKKTEVFMNVLWNLHAYFKQFLPNVQIKIKDLRTPIEKKLKDYIKIVKWKDISYWAIKDTCEKTHKTLHKFIREFEQTIKQPVTACLTTLQSNTENVGIWDRPQRRSLTTYHYTLESCNYMSKQSHSKKIETVEGIFKADKYFTKARILCKASVEAAIYPKLIQSLDVFITDVIDRSIQLQNLEVNKELPKEKQKSQAKSILQQKRKALADLFKALLEMGLSYRIGLIEAQNQKITDTFLMKPIDLNAALHLVNHCRNDEKLLTIWDGCEMYYTKSLARLNNLERCLLTPSKELGNHNLERCKGFSFHLMGLLHKSKSRLVETSRILYYLRYYLTTFNTYCDCQNFIGLETYESMKQLFKNILSSVDQYKLLLETCPNEVHFGNELYSNMVLQPENPNFIKFKNDEVWKESYNYLNEVKISVCKLVANLEKNYNNLASVSFEVSKKKYISINDTVESIIIDLNCISTKLDKFKIIFGEIPLMDGIGFLLSEIETLKVVLSDTLITTTTTRKITQFKNNVQKLMQRILLVTQNIYKKHKTDIVVELKEDDVSANHLKVLIIDELNKDLETLEMPTVLKLVHGVAQQFLSTNSNDFKNILKQVLPLLDQIILLYHYYVTQQVSAYRAVCKMSSILSNIFIDLATKGFCIPPEFSEELNAEGQSEQAGGGLGLGEGEGERDVSDRIESEDQLDDAQPAGEEKKPDDKDCKEEEKGIEMSEDFDGKLQDIDKGDDDDEEQKSDADDSADEQMGETDKGADKLDQEIWGSDEENTPESGDEQEKEETGGKGEKIGENELGAKENEPSGQEEQQDKGDDSEKRKEINEMEEPEYDDQQVDPYHGNLPEYPEPEPMDLPEDMTLDDDMQDKDEGQEEGPNPFDIDTMKEQMPPAVNEEENNQDIKNEDQNGDMDDDVSEGEPELPQTLDTPDKEEIDPIEEDSKDNLDNKKEPMESEDVSKNEIDTSALDQTQSKEEKMEAMDLDDVEAVDNVQTNPAENQKSTQPNEEVCQEEEPDQTGVGQSRMEKSTTGHQGQIIQQDVSSRMQQDDRQQEMKRKPGESDSKRSLGDTSEKLRKKLKTIDVKQNEEENNEMESEDANNVQEAEMYQHISNAENSDEQILDTATEEQADQQKETIKKDFEEGEEPTESSDKLQKDEEDDIEINEAIKQKAEQIDSEKKKTSNKGQHPEGEAVDEMENIEIEGDFIPTMTVARHEDTTHHTQYSSFKDSHILTLTIEEINNLRAEVEQQLSVWNEPPSTKEAEKTWEKITSVTSSLAQGLSEQLRLVLEPTQASRLKGDYRTGRRINMRKIIPYIASQFRKDKIWLRRTKPSKREYQIVLAIDDSSSMNDNQSKELAFESIALISKALTLLESGQLSVLSFGETTEVLHKLTDTFTEKSGAKLLQQFKFAQKKTCVGKLVNFATEMLSSAHSNTNALLAKLLIIVGDGRGIFCEGESYVLQAVRQARLSNIFMIFVIVDNPLNRDSILDIRKVDVTKTVTFTSYMDLFPFPFYILLRDINSLPNVLSDALKQWFELVSNSDK